MEKKIPNNTFSLLYFLQNYCYPGYENISPYHKSIISLLNKKYAFKDSNFRIQQSYQFIAKILIDEQFSDLPKIKNNSIQLNDKIRDYLNNKSSFIAEEVVIAFFHCWLLKLCSLKKHYELVERENIIKLLSIYNTRDKYLSKQLNMLKLYFLNEDCYEVSDNNDILNLAYDLLYFKLRLNLNRDSKILLDYYLAQTKIEESSYELINNNDPRIFEIALLLFPVSNKGLFIPYNEKEVYISKFSKELIVNKYTNILNDNFNFKIKSFKLPIWTIPIIIFSFEIFLSYLPNFVDSISLINLSIKGTTVKNFISTIPKYIILIFNAILFGILTIILKNKLYEKVHDGI